jgi:hypothetical protein
MPEYGDQLLQERSWGTFIGFPLRALPEGEYTTPVGELTFLAIKHFGYLLHMKDQSDLESQRLPAT